MWKGCRILGLGSAVLLLVGCGGSNKSGPPAVEVLTTGVYSGEEQSRAVGDRLDADLVVSGQAVTGFARLRTGDNTFDSTSTVSGTAGRDGVITMQFPREGTLTLQRQGISDRFLSRRVKGSTTTDGQYRLRKIVGTNQLEGRWTGNWVQGANNTALDLRFNRAGNWFQVTGTTVRGAVPGRVLRGVGTIVGDRVELFIEFTYPSILLTNSVRLEGQVVNNRIQVGTFSIQKQP